MSVYMLKKCPMMMMEHITLAQPGVFLPVFEMSPRKETTKHITKKRMLKNFQP